MKFHHIRGPCERIAQGRPGASYPWRMMVLWIYWKPMFLICNFQGPECCRLSSFKCILLARSMPLSLVQHIQLAFIKSHSYLCTRGTWLTLLPLLVEISNKRQWPNKTGFWANKYGQWGQKKKKKKTAQNSVLIVWTKWKEHLVLLYSVWSLAGDSSAFSDLDTEGEHSRAAEEPALSSNTKRKWLLNKVSQLRSWKRK